MSAADKRKGNTHAIRTSISSRNSSIIAPPPRAQLTGPSSSSSPLAGPENDNSHEMQASATSRDTGASQMAKERDGVLLKEKDEKIAHLQRELAVMEAEFTRELDRLSQTESETAGFWQAKHSSLNQQFLRTDTELRLLRAEVDVREAERAELREGWEILRRELKQRDEEIRSLKGQISGLKQWVSTSTKKTTQTSDEEFGDALATLRNGLQNWVVSHYRKASFNLKETDGAVIDELGELVPMYEELAVAETKPHFLQSVLSNVLVEMVFNAYFVGLPDEEAALLSRVQRYLASLSTSESVNQWRAMTLTMFRNEAFSKLQSETMVVTEQVVSRVNHILNGITDASQTDARDQALRALVNNSISLARLLVSQKAVFRVTMPKILPHQRILFDPVTMDDIGVQDEESLTGREVRCITFPSIIKCGDENGSHPHFQNIIAKARVLCSPE